MGEQGKEEHEKRMATGPIPDNTDRLSTGSSGSLKPQYYVEEHPAPLILAFLPWSLPPGHSSSNRLLSTALT